MRDLDHGGVLHQVADVADGLLVQRCREEQRLAVERGLSDDLAHRGEEAHVQHAVGLVQDQGPHAGQVAAALLDQVDQAAGGGHQHVAAALEGALLRLVAHAADDGDAVVAGPGLDRAADVLDLLGELAGGGHDEHAGAAADVLAFAAAVVSKGAHRGQQEGRRLAGAGLCRGQKVATGQHLGDGLALHGGGALVAQVGHGLEDLLGKAQVGKAALVRPVDGVGRGGALVVTHVVWVSILRPKRGRCVARPRRQLACPRRRRQQCLWGATFSQILESLYP